MEFSYTRPVAYYETDAMGVVHHSNFIRMFEDARVAWLRERGIDKVHAPHSDVVFAVVDASCQYMKPLRFGDFVKVRMQVQGEGAKVRFRYAVYKNEEKDAASLGSTLHVAIDKNFKITKPPSALASILKEEKWTETWP
jgi:acyl-CoA thioester hydrolase